jgi:hypothetical protein
VVAGPDSVIVEIVQVRNRLCPSGLLCVRSRRPVVASRVRKPLRARRARAAREGECPDQEKARCDFPHDASLFENQCELMTIELKIQGRIPKLH